MKLMNSSVAGRLAPPIELPEQRSIGEQSVPPSRAIGVLVVDDLDDLRGTICDCVRSLGYVVLEASSAVAAMSVLDGPQGSQVDIVLSDINLPDLPGVALAGLAQARWPRLKLLLMSGEALAGNYPFLQKPFRRQALATALSDLCVTRGEPAWQTDRPMASTDNVLACTIA